MTIEKRKALPKTETAPILTTRPMRRRLSDATHDLVLEAIVTGSFAPGERLNDDVIASWLNVSRTPVREAFTRLAAHDFVESDGRAHLRVASPGETSVREAVVVLTAIYVSALGWNPGDADLTALDHVTDAARALLAADGDTAAMAFHTLLEVCGDLVARAELPVLASVERPLRLRARMFTPGPLTDADHETAVELASRLIDASHETAPDDTAPHEMAPHETAPNGTAEREAGS